MKEMLKEMGTILLFAAAGVLVGLCVRSFVSEPLQGDMDNDGVLTLVDISILAEIIKNK